jgi:hypothetical protein
MSLIAKRSIYLIDAAGLTEFHGVGMKVQQTPTEGGGEPVKAGAPLVVLVSNRSTITPSIITEIREEKQIRVIRA